MHPLMLKIVMIAAVAIALWLVFGVERLAAVRRGLSHSFWALRINWLIAAAFVGLLVGPDQAADILRAMADGPGEQSAQILDLAVSTLLLSQSLRWTSVELIRIHEIDDARAIVPPLIGVAPWLGAAFGAWLAASAEGDSAVWAVLVTGGAGFVMAGLTAEFMIQGALRLHRRARPAAEKARDESLVAKAARFVYGDDAKVSGPVQGWLTALTGIFFALLMAGLWNSPFLAFVGPLAVVAFLLSFWATVLGPVSAIRRRLKLPALTVLAAAFVLSGAMDWNDNHGVRRLAPTVAANPIPSQTAFERWLSGDPSVGAPASERREIDGALAPNAGRIPVYLVAAEGGGLRNAYWTALVLSTLADTPGLHFRDRLFAVSGVSGGSVGAAVYAAASRAEQAGLLPAGLSAGVRAMSLRALGHDLLSPTLAWGLSLDLVQQFVPGRVTWVCRARALERALEDRWPGGVAISPLRRGFFDLLAPVGGGRPLVPYLMLNSTDVATGGRVVTSHLRIVGGPALTHDSLGHDDIPLSTAAFLSARFPIVTPVGTVALPGGRKLRLADGGYFENSGCATLLDLLRELTWVAPGSPMPWWWDRVEFRVILINYGDETVDPHAGPHKFGDPMSPLRTLLATREARGRLAVQDLERFVGEAPGRELPIHPEIFVFRVIDGEAHLPLGWYLSPASRRTMERQMPGGDLSAANKAEQDSLEEHARVIRKMRELPR